MTTVMMKTPLLLHKPKQNTHPTHTQVGGWESHITLKCTCNNHQYTGKLMGSGNSNGIGYAGVLKMQEHEKHVNNMQMRQTDKSWQMTS